MYIVFVFFFGFFLILNASSCQLLQTITDHLYKMFIPYKAKKKKKKKKNF